MGQSTLPSYHRFFWANNIHNRRDSKFKSKFLFEITNSLRDLNKMAAAPLSTGKRVPKGRGDSRRTDINREMVIVYTFTNTLVLQV